MALLSRVHGALGVCTLVPVAVSYKLILMFVDLAYCTFPEFARYSPFHQLGYFSSKWHHEVATIIELAYLVMLVLVFVLQNLLFLFVVSEFICGWIKRNTR